MSILTDFIKAIFGSDLDALGRAFGRPVDIHAILKEKAAKHPQKGLDWQHSIVDLMKLLNLDSAYSARKRLAVELGKKGYKGTAADNQWLHAEVMRKLKENGGRVPSYLQ